MPVSEMWHCVHFVLTEYLILTVHHVPSCLHWNIGYRPKSVFTARCTLVQSAVLRSHVVSLSVCLSVTLVNCDHIGWNSSKIISP